jgi:hypothetical protein
MNSLWLWRWAEMALGGHMEDGILVGAHFLDCDRSTSAARRFKKKNLNAQLNAILFPNQLEFSC